MFAHAVARPEAFDGPFDRMWPTTVGLVRRLVDASDAEGVAVEAFARALERWSSLRRHANVDVWLLRVVTNVAVEQSGERTVCHRATRAEERSLRLRSRSCRRRSSRRCGGCRDVSPR